jgi:hypothetical protein
MLKKETFCNPIIKILEENDITIKDFKEMLLDLDREDREYINKQIAEYLRWIQVLDENAINLLGSTIVSVIRGKKIKDTYDNLILDTFDDELKLGLDYLEKLKTKYNVPDVKVEYIQDGGYDEDKNFRTGILGEYKKGVIYINTYINVQGARTHAELLEDRKRKLTLREKRKERNNGLEKRINIFNDSVLSILVHEFGHYLNDKYKLLANIDLMVLFSANKENIAYELDNIVAEANSLNEFLAEAFAESCLNDARPLSLEVREIIDRVVLGNE